MASYTKEFLIDAYMARFIHCSLITIEQLENLEKMANDLYDRVGKAEFRKYSSLDSNALKVFKQTGKRPC